MDGMDGFDALHFDDYDIFDDQIDAIPEFNLLSIEHDGQPHLAGDFEPALSKFMREAPLIGTFQQTWTKHRVDVHRRRDDRAGDLVDPKRSRGRR